jgi:hypothetical protein
MHLSRFPARSIFSFVLRKFLLDRFVGFFDPLFDLGLFFWQKFPWLVVLYESLAINDNRCPESAYQMRPGLGLEELCRGPHVNVPCMHLSLVSFIHSCLFSILLTLLLSHAFCCLRRIASSSTRFFLFSSAASSVCCLSLSCWRFSISSRFLCAGLAEVLFRLLNTFPKSRCVRLRSSVPVPVLAADGFLCEGGDMALGDP